SLLYLEVPKPAFDRGKRLIVAVLKAAVGEGRICIEHVLYTNRNGGVIQPGAPSTAVILSRGDRDDVFLLAVLHFYILTAVLSNARHWCRGRQLPKVERVRCNQVKCRPRGDGAVSYTNIARIFVMILANPVNHCAGIETLHPRVTRTVVVQT